MLAVPASFPPSIFPPSMRYHPKASASLMLSLNPRCESIPAPQHRGIATCPFSLHPTPHARRRSAFLCSPSSCFARTLFFTTAPPKPPKAATKPSSAPHAPSNAPTSIRTFNAYFAPHHSLGNKSLRLVGGICMSTLQEKAKPPFATASSIGLFGSRRLLPRRFAGAPSCSCLASFGMPRSKNNKQALSLVPNESSVFSRSRFPEPSPMLRRLVAKCPPHRKNRSFPPSHRQTPRPPQSPLQRP